jgi:hypothetical protein
VFVAKWDESPDGAAKIEERAPDRIMRDVAWLADPAREGRGVGTAGLDASGAYIEQRFGALHLKPAGEKATYRQSFSVTSGIAFGPKTALAMGSASAAGDAVAPLEFSSAGDASGPLVLAGYGIVAKDLGIDDYAGVDVKGKIVIVRRFVPDDAKLSSTDAERRYGDLRYKAWVARERGAKGIVVVDLPAAGGKTTDEAAFPSHLESSDDAGILALVAKREALADVALRLSRGEKIDAHLTVDLEREQKLAFNVIGRLAAGAPDAQKLPGVVVIGAHYDHLGMGGHNSLAPDQRAPHTGADDNASGTSTMLEVARTLAAAPEKLRRDVIFIGFSGEEEGVLGSTAYTRAPTDGVAVKDIVAMLNMDMVGRMRANRLSVLGTDTANEWKDLAAPACDAARVDCTFGGDGYGPSDHAPFYAAGVPVLFFFTGAHADYHKPSDAAALINAAGASQVASIVTDIATQVSARDARPTLRSSPAPAGQGDRRSFHASLGTIPDYAGPPNGQRGVLLAGVRAGGAADKAGMRRGDVLVRLGDSDIGSVEDFMFSLNAHKPGETVTAVVIRDGQQVKLPVTFQEGKGR